MKIQFPIKKILNIDYRALAKRHRTAIIRSVFMLPPGVYVAFALVNFLRCRQGIFGCSMNDFIVVAPFYTLVASFTNKLNFIGQLLLYVISSTIYLAAFYYLGLLLEQQYDRIKNRPRFVLKRL